MQNHNDVDDAIDANVVIHCKGQKWAIFKFLVGSSRSERDSKRAPKMEDQI